MANGYARETAKRVTPKIREYNRILLAKILNQQIEANQLGQGAYFDLLSDMADVENQNQKARQFSFSYFRGETFSLSYWSQYDRKETVLIPAGTPINEANLTWAVQEMDKQRTELTGSFGRFYEREDNGHV